MPSFWSLTIFHSEQCCQSDLSYGNRLNRYVGYYDRRRFMRSKSAEQPPITISSRRSVNWIPMLKTSPCSNMAISRQKKLDRRLIERKKNQSRIFHLHAGRAPPASGEHDRCEEPLRPLTYDQACKDRAHRCQQIENNALTLKVSSIWSVPWRERGAWRLSEIVFDRKCQKVPAQQLYPGNLEEIYPTHMKSW